MTERYITLGDGRTIGLGRYVAAWRQCLALPPRTPIGKGIGGWGETAGEALAKLRCGLHDRINKHLSWYGNGRKWHDEWQHETSHAACQLNQPRLRIYGLPVHLRERFKDRIVECLY
jgi:hypothetical protein